jgi:hypothetical protein
VATREIGLDGTYNVREERSIFLSAIFRAGSGIEAFLNKNDILVDREAFKWLSMNIFLTFQGIRTKNIVL